MTKAAPIQTEFKSSGLKSAVMPLTDEEFAAACEMKAEERLCGEVYSDDEASLQSSPESVKEEIMMEDNKT